MNLSVFLQPEVFLVWTSIVKTFVILFGVVLHHLNQVVEWHDRDMIVRQQQVYLLAGYCLGNRCRLNFELLRRRILRHQRNLLPSQLVALEPPTGSELTVDGARPPAEIVRTVRAALGL